MKVTKLNICKTLQIQEKSSETTERKTTTGDHTVINIYRLNREYYHCRPGIDCTSFDCVEQALRWAMLQTKINFKFKQHKSSDSCNTEVSFYKATRNSQAICPA